MMLSYIDKHIISLIIAVYFKPIIALSCYYYPNYPSSYVRYAASCRYLCCPLEFPSDSSQACCSSVNTSKATFFSYILITKTTTTFSYSFNDDKVLWPFGVGIMILLAIIGFAIWYFIFNKKRKYLRNFRVGNLRDFPVATVIAFRTNTSNYPQHLEVNNQYETGIQQQELAFQDKQFFSHSNPVAFEVFHDESLRISNYPATINIGYHDDMPLPVIANSVPKF